MKRFSNTMLIVSWAWFLWIIYYTAADRAVSNVFWINLTYVAATITAAIVLIGLAFWAIAGTLRPRPAGALAIGVGLMLAIAAIEVFFLRDIVAGWLAD